MYAPQIEIKKRDCLDSLKMNRFELEDKHLFSDYLDHFNPVSCEYNFSNLFAWQDVCQFSWTMVEDRIFIYNGVTKAFYMPLGEGLRPQELALFSLKMQQAGFSPDLTLCLTDYLEKYPEIENYYQVEAKRDHAEYVYDVDELVLLKGVKLHKKRNLISQFKRSFPEFEVHCLNPEDRSEAFELARTLMQRYKKPPQTILDEFSAIQKSFECYAELGLEGLVIKVENKIVAFSVFSKLNSLTYDIHFEKSDIRYKGSAQLMNQETARYLKDRCRYLNREQDLGITGLRQAKLSYDPEELVLIHSLKFNPMN